MISTREIKDSFLHFLFPHICAGCGSDLTKTNSQLCIRCIDSLPETNFELYAENAVEKIFWGRLPLAGATAQFYFTKESLMQELMHQLKYKGNRELGLQLGRMMGRKLFASGRFRIDALIPLPLFAAKEKQRGYNQSTILCEGIAEIMQVPILDHVIIRTQHTETQTHKGRVERWENIEGKFELRNNEIIEGKHILLIDDVVTTGATLEACGNELIREGNTRLSIATLCMASH